MRRVDTPPPSEEMIRLLSRFDLKVGELALELRSLVLREAPGAIEKILDTYVLAFLYTLTDRWSDGSFHIVVNAKHVNMGFSRGAELDDPDGLLEGTGKQIRHIKIRERQDLKLPHLRKFVRAAIKNAKLNQKERALTSVSKAKLRPSAEKRSVKRTRRR